MMTPPNQRFNLIELKNISKVYHLGKQSIQALQDINLTINKGEFISIIGPSGSGKSTLLHLIGGLDHPTTGEILIDGENITKLRDREISALRNQKIGFVFQDFHLLEDLTIEENISLPLLIKSGKKELTKAEQKHVKKVLDELELSDRAAHHPTEISGGQKQRVAIGRALINEPEILLADEPTGNLDDQTAQHIINLFNKIYQHRKITLIIITHDQQIAKAAHQLIQIKNGKILK